MACFAVVGMMNVDGGSVKAVWQRCLIIGGANGTQQLHWLRWQMRIHSVPCTALILRDKRFERESLDMHEKLISLIA